VSDDRLLTSAELADYLGFSLGWVRDHWQAGDLPGFQIGLHPRFRVSDVEEWLDARRRGPAVRAVR
jgi:excisionase family DNA binding protein